MLTRDGKELNEEMELLIRGEAIEADVEETIRLPDVSWRVNVPWSFLLMVGYLKQSPKERDDFSGTTVYKLSIPNMEVRGTFVRIVDNYFSTKIESGKLETMRSALIEGDVKLFEKMLRKVVAALFSYHDFGGEVEKIYRALAAGLLIWMSETHEIKSNYESGYGRYDIMIIPREPGDPGQTGYVIEFRAVDPEDNETVPSAVKAAFQQIEKKKYESRLINRGIRNIKKLAVVFSGKDVYVNEASITGNKLS